MRAVGQRMSQSLVMRPKQRASMGGNKSESDRLRPLFLRWVGQRFNSAALKSAGIPLAHGMAWLGSDTILRDCEQAKVRKLLDEAGIAGSPCS